jgi:hypothetical protein
MFHVHYWLQGACISHQLRQYDVQVPRFYLNGFDVGLGYTHVIWL